MEARGVALGTLLAQYCGLLLGIYFIIHNYYKILRYWSFRSIMKLKALKRFFLINRDIFIRTLCLICVFTFFTSESASNNKTILAVNSLLLQFIFIFSYFMDGFAYAAEALVGKYVGRQNREAFNKVTRLLFIWGIGISTLFTLVYGFGSKPILSLLTTNENILSTTQPYIKWIILLPMLSFASFLFDGIYIGATASVLMRKTMMAATFLVFFPLYWTLNENLMNHALWIAMLGFLFSRGIFQAIYFRKRIPNLSFKKH